MVAPVYFETNPPLGPRKFYPTRNADVSAIVVHTAENFTDLDGADLGAENVANYLRTTQRQASYHAVVDSDSAVWVCRPEWTAFHCVGFNSRSLGLSFATRAADWSTIDPDWVAAALVNGAHVAAEMAAWVQQVYGLAIPAHHIDADEARRGNPGFVCHSEIDPTRRYDPGDGFDWPRFLHFYNQVRTGEPQPTKGGPMGLIAEWQTELHQRGYQVGAADDIFGRMTSAASYDAVTDLDDAIVEAERLAVQLKVDTERLTAEIVELKAELDAALRGQLDADAATVEAAARWQRLQQVVTSARPVFADLLDAD